MKFSTVLISAALCTGFVQIVSCKASDDTKTTGTTDAGTTDGTDDGSDDGTTPPGTLALSNELGASYPQGLAISAFPTAVDASPGSAAPGTVAVSSSGLLLNDPQSDSQEFKPFEKHPKEKLEEDLERLNGEADSCFSDDIVRALTFQNNNVEICYGFDYGMVGGNALGTVDRGQINPALSNLTDQSLAGVRTALTSISGLEAPEQDEACMVAVGRAMIEGAVAKVDASLQLFQGMLCQAKKDGTASELPAIGETLDLSSVFADYTNATVSTASIERLEDRGDYALYKSRLTLSVNGGPLAGKEINVTLVHSPTSDDNTTYDGTMWFSSERDNGGSTYKVLTSVAYNKSGSTVDDQRLRFEIRNADFNSSKVSDDPIAADGRIDYNPGVANDGSFGAGNQNDYISGISYFAFDVNPSTYAGNMSFWTNPGGSYGEAARGFVFNTTEQDDGSVAGCAYSGAILNTSIRKAFREDLTLEPTGCYTPQLNASACGTVNDNVGTQIWRQCFKQEESGYYTIDTANVTDTTNGFDIIEGSSVTPARPDLDAVSGVGDVNTN